MESIIKRFYLNIIKSFLSSLVGVFRADSNFFLRVPLFLLSLFGRHRRLCNRHREFSLENKKCSGFWSRHLARIISFKSIPIFSYKKLEFDSEFGNFSAFSKLLKSNKKNNKQKKEAPSLLEFRGILTFFFFLERQYAKVDWGCGAMLRADSHG